MNRVARCGTVVRPGDPGYDADRVISNARFLYSPREIHYCDSAARVSYAIQRARELGVPVRIRSGGHQHEGMCTADGVVLIDLSCINKIEFQGKRVWIGAGASLNSVYAGLWQSGFMFAGGGCGDVHVGGLTQGGGWGPVARKFGMTCDSLFGVEMVTATGQTILATDSGTEAERNLLRALRGGGGGNFGVVTRFNFQLHPWPEAYTDITLSWGDESLGGGRLEQLIVSWIRAFPTDADQNLTTFLRLSVVDQPGGVRVIIGGRYLGTDTQARAVMARLLAGQPAPRSAVYKETKKPSETFTPEGEPIDPDYWESVRHRMGSLPGYQPGPLTGGAPGGGASDANAGGAGEAGAGAADAEADADLGETCAGVPLRHKISSGFARVPFDLAGVQRFTEFITTTKPLSGARQYLSLHCLGGAIARPGEDSAFAFRDRHFLLQYQAWWQPDCTHLDIPCIDWIEKFRLRMQPFTDGAFINFVDRDIPLQEYYKGKLPMLIGQKQIWDRHDFFKFQLGIPTS